jgi:energy-converting hydrogenase Eha subunit A
MGFAACRGNCRFNILGVYINLAKSIIINYLTKVPAIQWQSLKWKTSKVYPTNVTQGFTLLLLK